MNAGQSLGRGPLAIYSAGPMPDAKPKSVKDWYIELKPAHYVKNGTIRPGMLNLNFKSAEQDSFEL